MPMMRRAAWCSAVVAGVLLSGCGGHPAAVVAAGPPPSVPVVTTLAPVTADLQLGDADTERTLPAALGERIVVTLHSTYWQVGGPSDPRIVASEGPPKVSSGGPGCPSIPGTGCGTTVASFVAVALGGADLVATRSTCGEALRCAADQSTWTVHVDVYAAGGPTPPAATAPPTVTTLPRTTTTAPAPATTAPVTTAPAASSGVAGTVLFSPVCPVDRVPPDPQCAPRPGPASVRLQPTGAGAVSSGQAGADGRFSILAPPGTYVVQATTSSPGRGCQSTPAQVTVTAGSFASVMVACDTGIR